MRKVRGACGRFGLVLAVAVLAGGAAAWRWRLAGAA